MLGEREHCCSNDDTRRRHATMTRDDETLAVLDSIDADISIVSKPNRIQDIYWKEENGRGGERWNGKGGGREREREREKEREREIGGGVGIWAKFSQCFQTILLFYNQVLIIYESENDWKSIDCSCRSSRSANNRWNSLYTID